MLNDANIHNQGDVAIGHRDRRHGRVEAQYAATSGTVTVNQIDGVI